MMLQQSVQALVHEILGTSSSCIPNDQVGSPLQQETRPEQNLSAIQERLQLILKKHANISSGAKEKREIRT